MPAETSNRTLVLTVVAVDLVGYSRTSVAEQMSLKDQFNRVLLQAISDISIADRIILDTGDGVAMGFLGDPEDALYVAMFMHDAINRDSTGSPSGGMEGSAIRIGINLGPVKLATGVGGHPNIIGDGINVAERIMGFAEPGQLTASRPVFEIMSRMSDHYSTLFQYTGVHTDKQVRAHDVYLVGKSPAAFRQAARGVAERAAARAGQPVNMPHFAAAASKGAAAPARAPVKGKQPSHPPPGKRLPESPHATVTAPLPSPSPSPSPSASPSPMPAKVKATAAPSLPPATGSGGGNPSWVDFLEDRNKVAITAFLLAIAAVTLGALLAYRKMLAPGPEASVPLVAAMSPAPAGKDRSAAAVPPSPAAPAARPSAADKSAAPAETVGSAAAVPALPAQSAATPAASKVESKSPPATAPASATIKPTPEPIAPTMPITPAAGTAPALAVKSPALAVNPAPTVAPKTEIKPPPLPATPLTAPPVAAKPAVASPLAPIPPAASATPAKGSDRLPAERPPLPAGKSATLPDAVRDKPKDAKIEKAERGDRPDKAGGREDLRSDPRKVMPPRTASEREKSPAITAAPIVPTYQSPAEAPRPELVVPTQKPAAPSAPTTDAIVVSRSAPPYPVEGIRQGIKMGFVKARMTIDAGGNVSDVAILEAKPIVAFGRETRNTLKDWKFNPGAPGRTYEIEITFKP